MFNLFASVPIAATALGATSIEKYMTLSMSDDGADSTFSLEPQELTKLVSETEKAYKALGKITYNKSDEETSFRKYRRSLFIVNDLPKGHVLTDTDIAILRLGDGFSPKYKSVILGRTLGEDVYRGAPVSWDILI